MRVGQTITLAVNLLGYEFRKINFQNYKLLNSICRFDLSKCTEDAEREINEIETQERQRKGESIFKLLKKASHLKNVTIDTLLFSVRTFCGREPISVYPGHFISELKTVNDVRIITVLQSSVDIIICLCSTIVMDSFNRRTLLYMVGCLGSLSAGGLIVCQFFINFVNSEVPWVIPGLYCVYASLIIGILFPLVALVACEIVSKSNEHRNMLYTIPWTINNALRAVFTAAFPTLIDDIDIVYTLLLFMCCNVLIMAVTKFFVVETVNKSLHMCVVDENSEGIDDEKI